MIPRAVGAALLIAGSLVPEGATAQQVREWLDVCTPLGLRLCGSVRVEATTVSDGTEIRLFMRNLDGLNGVDESSTVGGSIFSGVHLVTPGLRFPGRTYPTALYTVGDARAIGSPRPASAYTNSYRGYSEFMYAGGYSISLRTYELRAPGVVGCTIWSFVTDLSAYQTCGAGWAVATFHVLAPVTLASWELQGLLWRTIDPANHAHLPLVGCGWQHNAIPEIGEPCVTAYEEPSGPPTSSPIPDGTPLKVVPEPSTWLLLATGLIAAGIVAWRRRRRTR